MQEDKQAGFEGSLSALNKEHMMGILKSNLSYHKSLNILLGIYI